MGRVESRVALVTGAAHGIGRATAILLAEEGAKVAVTDVDAEACRDVVSEIEGVVGTAHPWELDVSDEGQVRRVTDEVVEHFGGLDVLVNNAGISGADRPTHELSLEEWERVQAVNTRGVFLCTKHAIPHMKKAGGGSIVNLSSIYGIVSAADVPSYHASKGAVRMMTKTDALFYAEDGIRVNSVHPGFVWTPMVEAFLESQGDVEAGRRELAKLHPLGRLGEPREVALAILFLASEESSFTTGAELLVDGGYTAR